MSELEIKPSEFKLPCKPANLYITSESSWENEVDRRHSISLFDAIKL